jgi:hypothetical protein
MHIQSLFKSLNFQADCEKNELQAEESDLRGQPIKLRCRRSPKSTKPRFTQNSRENNSSNAYQEMWRLYETEWNDFSATPPSLVNFDSIPFPPCDDDLLEFIGKFNLLGRNFKAAYRLACRRFHPDKFMQHFGSNIDESDADRIRNRLNSITQSLNSQYASCKRLRRTSSEPPRYLQ